ncbi:hypothetical protein [Kribbella sp. NPDC003557]|uniref:hypothetical protein n=1 Tax=Kribbella sp. NPDC003557 TaxID=3154449 RepID=UPI0033AC5AB9
MLGVVGLVASIALVANRARTDDPAATRPTAQRTPGPPTSSAPGTSTPGFALCRPGRIATCFPRATAAGVSAILEHGGATCRQAAAWTIVCHQGDPSSIDLYLLTVPRHPEKLERFYAITRSANADGRVLVERNLRAWLPTILSALLPGEPVTQHRIAQWIPKDLGMCPSGDYEIDGYRVSCLSPRLKDEFGRASTSWTAGVDISPDY